MNKRDNHKILNNQFRDKVRQELSSFRSEVLQKNPEAIYDRAYQIVTMNEIVRYLGNMRHSSRELVVLLTIQHLLDEIYEVWLGSSYLRLEDIEQTILEFKNYILQTKYVDVQKEKIE